MRSPRLVSTLLATAIGASLATGTAGCTSADGSSSTPGGLDPSTDPQLDAGRVLVERECDLCHTLDRIKAAQKNAGQWAATVERMRGKGAALSDQQAQQVVDYLASR